MLHSSLCAINSYMRPRNSFSALRGHLFISRRDVFNQECRNFRQKNLSTCFIDKPSTFLALVARKILFKFRKFSRRNLTI